MKAQDLVLEELLENGHISIDFHGRRLLLTDLCALEQLKSDLITQNGVNITKKLLTRYGYLWGYSDAATLNRMFKWDSPHEFFMSCPKMLVLNGFGSALVKDLYYSADTKTMKIEVVLHNSAETQFCGLDHTLPKCWVTTGYASGFISRAAGFDVFFAEDNCIAKGDKTCISVGKDAASCSDELSDFMKSCDLEELRVSAASSAQIVVNAKKVSEPIFVQAIEGAEVRSPAFRRILEFASRAARFDSSILITGETGTGKEVLARYIHGMSPRSKGPFLAVNCGALPETLLESELFGHKAGSFTGATQGRIGLFEQARQGTIFLDEIGEISPALEVKLLRALQEKEITRVGENLPRKVDVRVVAATNRDIAAALAKKEFREDLYYRLAVIEIQVPSLRERPEDIIPLARYFTKQFAQTMGIPKLRIDASCLDHFQNYLWPGNVRELENAIERAAVFSHNGLIVPEHLPAAVVNAPIQTNSLDAPAQCLLEYAEIEHINKVLNSVNGNKTKASKMLGISISTLWRKLKYANRFDS